MPDGRDMGGSDARPTIPPLTSLRFFAAAVVVAFHFDPDRFANLPSFLQSWIETGYEAVTFFYVLSGFVLSYVYTSAGAARRTWRLRDFFVARFGRLFPAYYVSLLVALPFFAGSAFVWGEQSLKDFAVHGVLVVSSLQAWWPPAALAWNPPGWSVSVEWFMYATFPLLLWATRFVSPGRFLAGSYMLVVCVAAFRVYVMTPLAEDEAGMWPEFAQFFPIFHLPQFIFGAALGRVHLLGPRPSPAFAGWMCVAGAVGLMIVFADVDELSLRVRSNAVLVIFFGMLIMGAAQTGHFARDALSLRPLIFLGNISYSIYALHAPISFWWEWLGPQAFGIRLPNVLEFSMYFALVVGASALCFVFVETPLRRRIRRWGAAKSPPAI
jgi:peptidoglycan/LPS O-acetylase OafA/YrhL